MCELTGDLIAESQQYFEEAGELFNLANEYTGC
jgi:hypothetical protein